MPSPSDLLDIVSTSKPRTSSTGSSASRSSPSLLSQPLTENAAAEFLSAINEDPDTKSDLWTILAVANHLIPARIEAFQVDGNIRTHVKVARTVNDKLEEDGKSAQAKQFRTQMQANAKKTFRGSWSETSRLLSDGKTSNTFQLCRSCILLSDMLSYGLFPERSYVILVAEALGIASSEATAHTAIRHLMFTASNSGIMRLSETIRRPMRFSRELLLKAFARLEAIGVKMTDPLWKELDQICWVVPDAREVKVEYETFKSTADVCEEMKSQASLWKLQFSDLNHPNGKHWLLSSPFRVESSKGHESA